MLPANRASQIFNNLKNDPANNSCFECQTQFPTFVSVNNGCFLCQSCVQSHLPLGFEVSRIKTIDEDWSIDDLKLITAGGNSSLSEFFTHYNIVGTPPNFKYCTRASYYYRDMLSIVAQDLEYPHACPPIEEGVQLMTALYPDLGESPQIHSEEIKVQIIPEPVQADNQKKKGIWQWAKSTYTKTVDIGNKAADKIGDKINKFSEKPKVKKIEDKTMEIANKIEAGLSNLINKVTSKPEVHSTIVQVNHAADSFATEVRFTYMKINADPAVQKLKLDTMRFLKDLASSVTGEPVPHPAPQ